MINGLLELLTTKKWMMEENAFDAFHALIQHNLNGHVALGEYEKKLPYRMGMATINGNAVAPIEGTAPGSVVEHSDNEPEVQRFCAILPVCGPITRNGDACSYGSIDLRDAVIEAADTEECTGIVFYINTPGGACSAVPDFKYAIDYAHEAGKPVIAFVDGMAASCGMYLAALCDKRFYMNAQDQIGSIGVMAAFYTNKDGDKDKYTDATWRELYATQSPKKNKWYRDAAEGDYKELQADLDKTCDEFINDVKAACPNAKPEHLDGSIFDAKDVDGILMDGQSTLCEVVGMILNADPDAEPAKKPATVPSASPEGNQAQSLNNNNIDMANYPLTTAACGVEELQVSEEGAFMNAPLLDALEQKLDAYEKAEIAAAQAAEASKKELDEVKDSLTKAQASLKETEEQLATARTDKETADKALTDANEAHAKALADAQAEAQKTLDAKVAELAEVQQNLDGAKASLATAEQALADKDAQIQALTTNPAQAPSAGATPANNGEGAEQPKSVCNAPQPCDYANMQEFNKAMAEYMASI